MALLRSQVLGNSSGFLLGGRFRLWKSIGGAPVKTASKRLKHSRTRASVSGGRAVFGEKRKRSVRIELFVPQEDVQAFDLFNQEHDGSARRCKLRARVSLEAASPSTQDL